MVEAINLGMPRIGGRRELKRAIEGYWAGRLRDDELAAAAAALRRENWETQSAVGVTGIPSNDSSLYDHVLDTCCLVGAIPERFGLDRAGIGLDEYFALARGRHHGGHQAPPLEMTKWFDTNYHYLVPELGPDTRFSYSSSKAVDEFAEARALGISTRPVLLGPVSFLLLAKATAPGFSPLGLLERILPVYEEVLSSLVTAGAEWVQLDEPYLSTDLSPEARDVFASAYGAIGQFAAPRTLVASYFGGLGDNLDLACSLGSDALHLDATNDLGELDRVARALPSTTVLSAGVVDGRNIWRSDLRRIIAALDPVVDRLGDDRVWVAPSCSLLHVPVDLNLESGPALDPELRSWLAFARQKLDEIATVARGVTLGTGAIADELSLSDAVVEGRRRSGRVRREAVRERLARLGDSDLHRPETYVERSSARAATNSRPILPTTTIGSFPQTSGIRTARRQRDDGEIAEDEYRRVCEAEIERAIRHQESLGLDVLVHGEAERNDMVQYFADHLGGFFTTDNGWVQSYGTRCVRPPILYGDVERRAPITRSWQQFARSLTDKPVKGMLTGPVTILKWSFVRDDEPRSTSCLQIALAIRDEVADLESIGTTIIQVDEPALREGLPLRAAERAEYLDWATASFRLATSGVSAETEIHTHMCYVELSEILGAIEDLDVDVISIEAARSGMGVLDDLGRAPLAAGVGPGMYDIHSPLSPSVGAIVDNIERALRHLPAERLWINPDCGLKTRTWEQVLPALGNMVEAATTVRARLVDATAP